jgi:pimeloyl-ACP methyl ester carboxylesterase
MAAVRSWWLVWFVLGASACADSSSGLEGDTPSSRVSWQPCAGLQCGTVAVPIDYDAPELGTIRIAINRVQASAGTYRGTVLLNPGGPGVPGKSFVEQLGPALRVVFPGYDFIGFDPRGVGESAPLRCSAGAEIDPEQVMKTSGVAGWLDLLRSESERCAAQAGPLFQHVGSNQVVADMDRIREALGEDEINFIGLSYGTRLGGLYAQAFPEHARAVVLDAPVAPVADLVGEVSAQFDALLTAHANFFADCASGELACPPDAQEVFAQIVAGEPTDSDRELFLGSWKLLLSAPPGREILAKLLSDVASGQLMASEDMPVMADVPLEVNTLANFNTNCADSVPEPPTLSEAQALMDSFALRSSQFAEQGIGAITCGGWQVQRDTAPALDFMPRVPPLVIGGSEDSLTPIKWAQQTASAIPGASLLLSQHYGHGALLYGSDCVRGFIHEYLDDLSLPPEGTICPPAQ